MGLVQVLREADYVVAASNASAGSKAAAAASGVICDGTADQTEINAAIATGRPVRLTEGTFNLSATINLAASNAQLTGSGWGTVLAVGNAVNAYAITFTATAGDYRNVRISDLKIDANGANQSTAGGGINANAAVQCSFERLYVTNFFDAGVRLGNSSGGGFGHHNRVLGCLFDNNGTWAGSGYGLDLFATDENFIAWNDFEQCGGNGTEPAAIIDRAGLNKFFGNNFVSGRNNARGIRLKDCHRSQVIGGTFDGVAGDNISVDGSSHRIIGVTFGSIGEQGSVAASGVLLNNTAVKNSIVGCLFQSSGTASRTRSFIRETGVGGAPSNSVVGGAFDTVGALSVGPVEVATGSTSRFSGVNGWNPRGSVTPPAVPASTVAATNTTGVDVQVFINGGTVSAVAIGGTATGIAATGRDVRLPAGQTITLTYTVAPTWTWFGD